MGLWSRLFGSSLPMPAKGRRFEDGALDKRVYYYFQHNALREAAFHPGHANLAEVIAAGRFGRHARYFWAKATHIAVQAGTVPPEMISMLSDASARALLESGVATLASIGIRTRRQSGFTVHLFVMPPPEYATDAHFIAVATADNGAKEPGPPAESVRYFVLEATLSLEPMFCEWTADGRHIDHGSRIVTDLESFTAEVLSHAHNRK